ncbi:Sbal_3080 family lipoprotein [Vibrio sp. PNB22_2_2]
MKNFLLLSLFSFILVGCGSPRYTGNSVPGTNSKPEVVIIKDNETRIGFLDTMELWLQENNYTYVVVPDRSKHDLDKITLEYQGHWGWDLALYLKSAEINAYQAGQRVGEVHFEVPYTANPNKFGDASKRISFMMDILFGQMTPVQATKAANSPSSTKPE